MRELLSLDDIYNKRIFRIPDYQRGFAWTKPQLIDFWEDLVSLSKNRFHYTGVISIKKASDSQIKRWDDEKWLIEQRNFTGFYIVDGQQRMTVISIFLQCLIEEIKSLRENQDKSDDEIYLGTFTLKEIIEKYLVMLQPPQKLVKSYLFGYETDNPSFEYLRHKIYNEPYPGTIQETYYTFNLQNAKDFFKSNIANIVKERGSSILQELFEKLTGSLKFNLYELSDDFDVFVAFETMNNRGKKLSNLELLKNRLIYLTSLYSEEVVIEDDRRKVREEINKSWKEIYFQLGRNKESPLNDDDFLRAHWILCFKYSRKTGYDYVNFLLDDYFNPKKVIENIPLTFDEILDVVEQRESMEYEQEDENDESTEETLITHKVKLSIRDLNKYVKSIKKAARHWYNTNNPKDNNDYTIEEQIWVEKLNRIQIGYFRPLVMAAFYKEDIDTSKRLEMLKAIERFIFLDFRVNRAQSNHRSSVYYNAARQLVDGELSPDNIIESLNRDMAWIFEENGLMKISPFGDYLQRKFISGSSFYGWNGLRYFLFEYEEYLIQSHSVPKVTWNNFIQNKKDMISVEHIYPQTGTKECWVKVFEGQSEEMKARLNNLLGNLLLLSKHINSSLQNECYKNKVDVLTDDSGNVTRNGYASGSYSEQKVVRDFKNWGPEQIIERSMELLAFMEKRWGFSYGDENRKRELLGLPTNKNTESNS